MRVLENGGRPTEENFHWLKFVWRRRQGKSLARGGDEYKKVAQLAELLLGQEGVVSRECPGFEPGTSLVLLAKLDSDDDPARHLCKMRHTVHMNFQNSLSLVCRLYLY